MVLSIDIEAAATLVGAKSGLRIKLLAELLVNPSREYTESELAKIGTCTSSAVAKSLRPLASGILKDILKTYVIYNSRIYKVENTQYIREIGKEVKILLEQIQQVDRRLTDLLTIQIKHKRRNQLERRDAKSEEMTAIKKTTSGGH